MTEKTVFIVGAGFSANAGLPLQSEFTEIFLKANSYTKGKSKNLMPFLGEFVEKVFGFEADHDLGSYPELEDVFTSLDLSANTGHHLGSHYAPKDLRMLRRMLLSRIIHMLNTAYYAGKSKPKPERERLLEFLKGISAERHQFVSLNWDTVLEGGLDEVSSPCTPMYSSEIRLGFLDDDELITKPAPTKADRLLIAKMHGSINWLYCDCCRRTHAVPFHQVSRLGSQVLQSDEGEKLYGDKAQPRISCPYCSVDLSVRLATFSFQKALRAPMFESSWLVAEKALRDAKKWVFIGYSLPAADFEFKYLLKRVQLARAVPPELIVVTKAPDPKHSAALRSYRKFFGEGSFTGFDKGMTQKAIANILS